jgi:hypothetical protein
MQVPLNVYYKNKLIPTLTWSELEKYNSVTIRGINLVGNKMPVAMKNGNLYHVTSFLQAIKMVDVERVDFAILIAPIADNLIEKEKIFSIKKFDTPIDYSPIYMLLSKKHKILAPKAC